MPAVPDSYNWLQLTKDILIPLSSTLVGAGVAYLAALKSSESQLRSAERERALSALSRIYQLTQDLERCGTYSYNAYQLFLLSPGMGTEHLRQEVFSSKRAFDSRELERLVELNFREVSGALSESRDALKELLRLIALAERDLEIVEKVDDAHSELQAKARAMLGSVATRSEASKIYKGRF